MKLRVSTYLHQNTVFTHKKGEFESCWCLPSLKNNTFRARLEPKQNRQRI